MAGTGTHLHYLILLWTGYDYTPGCKCREIAAQMDANPPEWTRDHCQELVSKLNAELGNRSWLWRNLLQHVPGLNAPIRWLILEAVKLAEADLASGQNS